MKVAPSYISKTKLMKKIEQRTAERAKRIVINKNIDTMDKSIIESQKDNLARFADRNQCTISFVPKKDVGGTEMKVYKDKHMLYRQPDMFGEINFNKPPIIYVEHIYKGSSDIPSSRVLTTDRNFANQIKENVKNVLNKEFNKKV